MLLAGAALAAAPASGAVPAPDGAAAATAAVVGPSPRPTYVRTTLGPGTADMYPVDIADTATKYYVIDPGRYSVFRIDRASGLVDKTAGGHQGRGPQDFAAARAIALSSAGDVYVADTPNNRIARWSGDLTWIQNFGTKGTGPGQFTQVYGVAVGREASGREVVYAVDGAGDVQVFTLTGQYLRTFGTGQLNQPRQLSVAPNGDVYVVNARARQIVVFSSSGTLLHTFGSQGSGPGQFSGDPRGVALTPSGDTVFVSDDGNGRVQAFHAYDGKANADGKPDGAYWYEVGSLGPADDQFVDARGLTVTDDGILAVTDEWDYAVKEFSLAGAPTETFVRKLFGHAAPVRGVNSPRGLAVGLDGRLFVADWWNQRIVYVDPGGTNVGAWGHRGIRSELGTLNFAWGVAVQPGTGRVFVANRESHEIEVFGPDGTSVTDWGQRGTTDGLFTFPQGLAFDPTDGSLLVADSGNNRIQRFRITAGGDGVFVQSYGGAGTATGKFATPTGIAVAADGTMWVADTLNNRLQKRSPAGTWTAYTRAGSATPYRAPWGVSVAPDGTIWVADSGNDRIVQTTTTGALGFTATGAELGASALDAPFGIAFGPQGQIWVSDLWDNRVIELKAGGAP